MTAKTQEQPQTGIGSDALLSAPVLFGLEAQGHMPTIATMLSNGHTWDQIAKEIGWERCTARLHYEARIGDDATKKLRATLAEAIEVLRMVYKRHRPEMSAEESNRMATAFMAGNNLLDTKTRFDF
jgi:hypothetical protein